MAAGLTQQDYRGRVEGMYYHFRQNNSRGMFKLPAVSVFVEADNEQQATEKFLTIDGCYFDPRCDFDCPCCGPRWTNTYSENLTLQEVYARVVQEKDRATAWMNEGIPNAYILHRDRPVEIL